jgi:hypothetical protein
MTEPALLDLLREQEPPRVEPDLEVDIEVAGCERDPNDQDVDCLLDPWFQRSEAEIASIEDDPTARIHEIRITGYTKFSEDYGTGFDDNWA